MRSSTKTFICFFLSIYIGSIGMEGQTNAPQKIYQLTSEEKKSGFKILFDGSSLDQWIDYNDQYYIREKSIVKKPGGNGNLYSKEEYKDFILRFEFQLTPGANNGIGIRHKLMNTNRGYDGMELQIIDNDAPIYTHLKPAQYHGSLYMDIPAKREGMKPIGEWNEQEVRVEGLKIKIILNGVLILDGNIGDLPSQRLKRNPRLLYEKGHIAFLGHDSEVMFRNIRVKDLEKQ
ncbi:DUF1080 domain-containing protein [Dysgonomonas sp. Marseille-P4677]|uniref:3-keto-disaccharide hydrolase n=1 Tax=Dysgonomonas sp. Marseille-P4677 TaxID=2364790 RepID=UPI0019125620|nr:DUF1080 domain-containing protein [Dysgonomonas sp. Marseille-P4677]MBK5719858.1 DUF1080 domain-containing protein [Dysgonomonas sp. Marseille-P4677]